jgi:hypothetical protein
VRRGRGRKPSRLSWRDQTQFVELVDEGLEVGRGIELNVGRRRGELTRAFAELFDGGRSRLDAPEYFSGDGVEQMRVP